jgi:urease gamma subunit
MAQPRNPSLVSLRIVAKKAIRQRRRATGIKTTAAEHYELVEASLSRVLRDGEGVFLEN